MRTIYKVFSLLLGLALVVSCVKEEMIEVNPDFIVSFQRDGQTEAVAGKSFYVIPTGSGEFISLYDGNNGRVWGEPSAYGIDLNKADSVVVTYKYAGKYQLTLVSSSAEDFGNELVRKTKTIEINVIDPRNSITRFSINKVNGEITKENEILFYVPDVTTDFLFVPLFALDSDSATVYVKGVEQISKESENDFSQPVVYTVKSVMGTEKTYTVKFIKVPSSDEKQLLRFALGTGGNGETGVIDEANKTVSLTANYASNIAAVRLVVESSYASEVFLAGAVYSDRKNYDISETGIKSVKVIAQNKSEVEYLLNVTPEKPVTSFTFEGLVPEPIAVIDHGAKTITVNVLNGTDIKNLKAKWTGSIGKVTIGTTEQKSGITINDYSAPVTYTFYKGTTAGDKYKVTVNVK